MKKPVLVLFLISFLLTVGIPLVCAQTTPFNWNLQAYNASLGASLNYSGVNILENGESFGFTISTEVACRCYVVCEESDGGLSVLYDELLSPGQGRIFGPYTLTPPKGTEVIYIIMSSEQQRTLERLLADHAGRPGVRTAQGVHNEILRIGALAAEGGESPARIVSSGGTVRNATVPVIETVQFYDKAAYVKTLTIRH